MGLRRTLLRTSGGFQVLKLLEPQAYGL
jgi:hypothetical protein